MTSEDSGKPSAGIFIKGGQDNVVEDNYSEGFDVGVHAEDTKRLRAARNTSVKGKSGGRPWFLRPFGIVFIAVVGTVVAAGIVRALGWV